MFSASGEVRLRERAIRASGGPDGGQTLRPASSRSRAPGSYYRVYQVPLGGARAPALYLQIARPERIDLHELPGEVMLFGIVAIVVTSLTFVFGLLFAKRSLAPAEAMFGRLRQFTHDASHELRTPLAAVGSSLDLALKTGDYEREIRAAKSELKQGSRLIERLLQLAELDELALSPAPVDMSALVASEVDAAPGGGGRRRHRADQHDLTGDGRRLR